MTGEATIRASLAIRGGDADPLNYSGKPEQFTGDVSVGVGPTPGVITATVAGVSADFSALTTPAYCRLMNLDSTNFVSYGIWDGSTFYPLGEILAGETYVLRLSRDLAEEFGTGTGTTGTAVNSLMFKADTASVSVLVEAFDA